MDAGGGEFPRHPADQRLIGDLGAGQGDDHVEGALQGRLADGDGLAEIGLIETKPMAGARSSGRLPHQQNQFDRGGGAPGDGQAVCLREVFHDDMVSANPGKKIPIYVHFK